MEGLPTAEEAKQILEVAYSLEGARAALKEHLAFSHEWEYDIVLLWAAQPHLRDVLPDECFHLAFSGAKSSGKTTATRIAAALADGEFFGGGTLAAMIRVFGESNVVGVDEIDSNNRRLQGHLEGILRIANDWKAVYKLNIPKDGGGWRPHDLEVGGPKVFNYRSQVEDALRSRALVIEMPRQHQAHMDINNLFLENPVGVAADWLTTLCARRVRKIGRRGVERHLRSPEFIQRVETFQAVLGRDNQIAALLLVISDILELELESSIRAAMKAKQEEEESYEDIRQVLSDLYYGAKGHTPDGEQVRIGLTEALSSINRQREADGQRSLSYKLFARIRREFGFQDGVNVVIVRKERGNRFLVFDAGVREALGIDVGDGA